MQPLFFWWEKLDLDQRRPRPTDLQSAPFAQTQAFSRMVGSAGSDPATRSSSGCRSTN